MYNSQQQTIVSLSKNMLFPKELLYRCDYTVKFSLNMQKKSVGFEKVKFIEIDGHW